VLELRREAMVMCTKNNFEAGYVNGTLGRVLSFDREDGYPVIETSDGREIKMLPASWSIEEEGKVLAEITQVPLRLAWAITVHKSQGMSLDAAEIDLRNAFTYGQGYVALSRVRTFAGMKVLGLNAQALLVDPRVVNRDLRFKAESDEAESTFGEMDGGELISMQKNFVRTMGGRWCDGVPGTNKRSKAERLKKENTFALTKELLQKGMSASAIARERKMSPSTIWGHIEKLANDGQLSQKDLIGLIPSKILWNDAYLDIGRAFEKCGTEKLKPVYEELGEQYDYDAIRLGRIMYTIK
jgi:hypothetical protein